MLQLIGLDPDAEKLLIPEMGLAAPGDDNFPRGLAVNGNLIRLGLRPLSDGKRREWILSMAEADRTPELLALVESLAELSAIGDLASLIAHRFNNVLTVVIGQADLLAARLPSNEKFEASLNSIRDQGKQASELARKILQIGREGGPEEPIPDLLVATQTAATVSHPNVTVQSECEPLCINIQRGHLFRIVDTFLRVLGQERPGILSATVSKTKGGQTPLPAILLPIRTPWAMLTLQVGDALAPIESEELTSEDDVLSGLLGVLKRSGCHIFKNVGRFDIYFPRYTDSSS